MSLILSLESIYHAFEDQKIFDDLNLSIHEKTITAILGKSGSGKSTLLQMMNGLVHPDSGLVTIFGEAIDYKKIEHLRLKIGYAVQGVGLFPHLTVAKNILLPGTISKKPDELLQKRLSELLDMVNLPSTIKIKPSCVLPISPINILAFGQFQIRNPIMLPINIMPTVLPLKK